MASHRQVPEQTLRDRLPKSEELKAHFPKYWQLYLIGAITLVAAVVFIQSMVAIARGTTPHPPTRQEASSVWVTPRSSSPGPTAPKPMSDGKWLVGKDVKPGKYQAKAPNGKMDYGCYWARLSGLSDSPNDVIANGYTEPGKSVTVTILASDKAFMTNDCGDWKPIGSG